MVPHQITLFAFTREPCGAWAILDIVETSYRHAARFFRQFRTYDGIAGVAACAPNGLRVYPPAPLDIRPLRGRA